MFADLHLHTIFSDGTYSPEELALRAREQGLGIVALTDHDTAEGCPRMAAACRAQGLEFITGTELTCELEGHELHLLGYFIDPANPPLGRAMRQFQAVRQQRIREMVRQLNALNIPLTAESVLDLANCQSPGRPHVARALVEGGVCRTVDEAFERFLKRGRPGWVPKFKIGAEDAIGLIHGAGGLAALAHPGLNRSDHLIPRLIEAGLDGLECFHSKHGPGVTRQYLGLAAQWGLLVTGGSDCHGLTKGAPLIGTVKLAGEYVERLKERAALALPFSPGPTPLRL